MRRILFFALSKIKNSKEPEIINGLGLLSSNPNNEVEKYFDRKDIMEQYGIRTVPSFLIIQDDEEPQFYEGRVGFELVMVKYG